MSYANGTQFYNLPQTVGTDKRDWFDTNSAFAAIDAALHSAVTGQASDAEAIATINGKLADDEADIAALQTKTNTHNSQIAALQTTVNTQANQISDVRQDAEDMITANNEGAAATSTRVYAIGDYFIYNDVLYKATAAIAVGDTIVPNTNCEATNVDTELTQVNNDLAMLDEVTVSDYSAELATYDRIYVKDNSKVYIKGRFVGNFTQGTEKKMFNVSQAPKLDFSTNPTYVMFNCVISGASTAPAYGYVKANGDVCVIPSESITGGTCILAFDYQY